MENKFTIEVSEQQKRADAWVIDAVKNGFTEQQALWLFRELMNYLPLV